MFQLEMKNISKRFGGIESIQDLDFRVNPGEFLHSSAPTAPGSGRRRPDPGSLRGNPTLPWIPGKIEVKGGTHEKGQNIH